MTPGPTTLERTIRLVLVGLAIISGVLVGLSFHMVYDPTANAVGFCGAGLILAMITEGLARTSRILGLGCLVGAIWVVVIVIVAAL